MWALSIEERLCYHGATQQRGAPYTRNLITFSVTLKCVVQTFSVAFERVGYTVFASCFGAAGRF